VQINYCLACLEQIKQNEGIPGWVPSTMELQMKYKGDSSIEQLVFIADLNETEDVHITEKTSI